MKGVEGIFNFSSCLSCTFLTSQIWGDKKSVELLSLFFFPPPMKRWNEFASLRALMITVLPTESGLPSSEILSTTMNITNCRRSSGDDGRIIKFAASGVVLSRCQNIVNNEYWCMTKNWFFFLNISWKNWFLILLIIDPPLIQVVRFPPSRGWHDGRRKAGWRGCLIFCV